MKGVVFTEFIEMIESRWSPAMADQIIQAARLPSGGSYTSVGTYDHGEMWSLLAELSKAVDSPVPELMRAFGEHLLGRFAAAFPALFSAPCSSFEFLEGVDRVIHREVTKLYPDAELPRFTVVERAPQRMVLLYESPRHFADLAEGLIRGCARHYGEQIDIVREKLPCEAGSRVRFLLERK
jgi:hypothetical protein